MLQQIIFFDSHRTSHKLWKDYPALFDPVLPLLGLGVGDRVLECFVLLLCCACVVNSSSSCGNTGQTNVMCAAAAREGFAKGSLAEKES